MEYLVYLCPSCRKQILLTSHDDKHCPQCQIPLPSHEIIRAEQAALQHHILNAPAVPLRPIQFTGAKSFELHQPYEKIDKVRDQIPKIGVDVKTCDPVDLRARRKNIYLKTNAWEQEKPEQEEQIHKLERGIVVLRYVAAGLISLVIFLGIALGMKLLRGNLFDKNAAAFNQAVSALVHDPVVSNDELATKTANPEPNTPIEYGSDITKGSYEEFLQASKGFLSAASVDELINHCRDAARVRPVIKNYYTENQLQLPKIKIWPEKNSVLKVNNLIIGLAQTEDYRQVALAAEPENDGWKVDWECFVGWSEVPWPKLSSLRPTRPVLLRAKITAEDYYNHEFSDYSKWLSFRLEDLENIYTLYGYMSRQSPQFHNFSSRFLGRRSGLMVVRIKFPESAAASNQVEITEFIEDGWVLQNDHTNGIVPIR